MRILALFVIDTDSDSGRKSGRPVEWVIVWTGNAAKHKTSPRTHDTHTHTHIIEEAGFLSLLLSNRGSYRAKSPWWQADVELGGVGGKKGNLWERCVSSRRRRRRRRCSGVHLLFLDVVNLSVYVPHKLSELFFFCLSAVWSQIYRCIWDDKKKTFLLWNYVISTIE